MRVFISRVLITAGIMILPSEVRKLVRGVLLYHVPGALTESEKAEVREAKAEWSRT
jgi:hypothetical protein